MDAVLSLDRGPTRCLPGSAGTSNRTRKNRSYGSYLRNRMLERSDTVIDDCDEDRGQGREEGAPPQRPSLSRRRLPEPSLGQRAHDRAGRRSRHHQ